MLVTEDGYEVLTQYPSDLNSLIVRDKRTLKKTKGVVVRKAVNIKKE